MKIASMGTVIDIPLTNIRGPAGPDGNPIGTIISFMGKTAPKDYLICDGSVYNRVDFPDLATFFQVQFGASNYFGGDGETTIAVPDLRNLFLRGYHGEAEEQLSGEIGVKQEGTNHPYFKGINSLVAPKSRGEYSPKNPDTLDEIATDLVFVNLEQSTSNELYNGYTSRPVNMAVLYCIKAKDSDLSENIYSLEERVVGRWIDGKPLYRKVYRGSTTYSTTETITILEKDFRSTKSLKRISGIIDGKYESAVYTYYTYSMSNGASTTSKDRYMLLFINYIGDLSIAIVWDTSTTEPAPFEVIAEYTKTTDQATIEIPELSNQSDAIATASYDFYQDYDKEVL